MSVIKVGPFYNSGGSRGEDGRPLLVVGLFSQHLVSAGLGWAGGRNTLVTSYHQ